MLHGEFLIANIPQNKYKMDIKTPIKKQINKSIIQINTQNFKHKLVS